jgi:hypothetical protein
LGAVRCDAVCGVRCSGGCRGAVCRWFSGDFYGFAHGLMTSLVAQFG